MKKGDIVERKLFLFSIFCISSMTLEAAEPAKKKLSQQEIDQMVYNWSRTFAEVMQLANKKHYEIENFEEAMVKGMDTFLASLDKHSGLLGPKTYKVMLESTSGQFYGIGIVIDNTRKTKDKFLTIVDTIPNGPADKIGLKPLDKIIEISGKPLEGMSTEEATTLLKGPRGSKVHVKILRENQTDLIAFDIIRDVVKEQNSSSFRIKDQNIYYISLNMFTENAVKQIEQILKHSTQESYKGLILDLRNNSGGLLTAAINIASLFLPKGSLVVVTKDRNDKVIERYVTKRDPIANNNVPIFIMINNYTASAAEILAACLKSHSEEDALKNPNSPRSQVFLVGTTSFGKGSVQEVIPISNNCAAKITTSLYFPNNVHIQGIGIEPDFVVERMLPLTEQMQWFTKYYGREKSHGKYIRTATSEESKDATTKEDDNKPARWADRIKEMLQTDNQLRETISLINSLSEFKTVCPQNVCNRTKAVAFLKRNHLTNDKLTIEEVQL
jgi:carboxyl-terminal processing protease